MSAKEKLREAEKAPNVFESESDMEEEQRDDEYEDDEEYEEEEDDEEDEEDEEDGETVQRKVTSTVSPCSSPRRPAKKARTMMEDAHEKFFLYYLMCGLSGGEMTAAKVEKLKKESREMNALVRDAKALSHENTELRYLAFTQMVSLGCNHIAHAILHSVQIETREPTWKEFAHEGTQECAITKRQLTHEECVVVECRADARSFNVPSTFYDTLDPERAELYRAVSKKTKNKVSIPFPEDGKICFMILKDLQGFIQALWYIFHCHEYIQSLGTRMVLKDSRVKPGDDAYVHALAMCENVDTTMAVEPKCAILHRYSYALVCQALGLETNYV